jgi:integrase
MLTDIKIRALKGGNVRREIPDGNGLYLIVQPSGSKSWALRFRQHGRPVKLTLGQYFAGEVRDAPEPVVGGPLTLKGARKLASETMLGIAKGSDPVAAKKEAETAKQQADENTFEAVALEYMKRVCGMSADGFDRAKKRSGETQHATLVRLVFPVIGRLPITQIRRRDIVRLLDNIEDERGPVMANGTLAIVRVIMNWHASRDDDFRSPIVKGMGRVKQSELARDRILTDAELRVVWKTAEEDAGPFGALIQFLLLTAARRNEAAEMPWAELVGTDWVLPKERNKVGGELIRPLSEAARAVLETRPKISPFVFTYGRGPLLGFSKPKRQFDAKVAEALGEALPRWTLHDLRRTARSLMSRVGVTSDHAERCLGHVIPGVRGVYDRHRYHAEMARAYEALAALIETIVNPPPDNILPDNILPFQKA